MDTHETSAVNKKMYACVFSFCSDASETERKLHKKLFQDYNMKVRPARYWEEKVMVRVGMTLSQLVSLVKKIKKIKIHTCQCKPSLHSDYDYDVPYLWRNSQYLFIKKKTREDS